MTIHVMCLTADGGLPIFTRKKGDCENLPFSTVASLNGVHMFFKSMGICMNSTTTEDWTLLWKDYEDVITFILCGRNLSEKKLESLSNLIFNSIKLFVNSEDLKNSSKIVERLKREAKHYMPIIDRLLDSLASDIPEFNDCILSTENSHLFAKLNEFSGQCESLFCCIVVNQKLAVGTDGWWDLDVIDRKLLITMLNSSDRLQTDVPVYLPKKSSNTAYRFISVPIAGCGVLCVICGSDPSYQEINNIAQNVFKNEGEVMKNVERCISKISPDALDISENIFKIVLLNKQTKKYVFARNVKHLTSEQYSVTNNNLENIRMYIDEVLEADFQKERLDENGLSINVFPADQHWCSEYYKCYVHMDGNENVLFVLFTASVPTNAMKLITHKTFGLLMQDKNYCW